MFFCVIRVIRSRLLFFKEQREQISHGPSLKGVCHEIFDLHFFNSGDLNSNLTPRCAAHRRVRLRGVHHNAESSSAVCITPWSQVTPTSHKTLQCASHCRVKLRGMHYTAESSSAVCIIPQSQAPQCASHCGVKMHTGESKSKSLGVSGCF